MYELLTVDPGLAQLIDKDAETTQLKNRAANNGYVDIFDVTVRKVTQGTTTVEEAIRVLGNIRQTALMAQETEPAAPCESPAWDGCAMTKGKHELLPL